jgi:tetratricopeptide (TPR) repeat protein
MMERATFVRSQESDQREAAIKAQTRDLLAAHDEAAALNLYREHFKGTSATPGDAYVFVGKTYLFMGHTENGLRCLDYALKTEPHVRGAHTYKGILALTNGDLTKAEDEFNAELANDPNYQTAIGELGEVRYRQGRWAEAAEQLTRSHTNTPELLYMLCDADLHLGKAEDADLTADLVAAYGRNNQRLMQDLITLLRSNGHAETAERLASTLSE